jgi:negative regulator of sigma E activity
MKSRILARTLVGLGVAGAVIFTAPPVCAANIQELLRRSTTVDRRLSYQGTKVLSKWYGTTEVISTVKTYHLDPDRTLMVGVNGELSGASVLQIGRQAYLKQAGQVYQRTPLPLPEDNTDLLFANYRIRQLRTEPIAGRKCVMVLIEPRYPGNPSKRVWLDLKTGLPLKTLVYNQYGQPTEQTIFVRIQYNPRLSPYAFYPPDRARHTLWPEVRPNFKLVQIPKSHLPPGYRLVEQSVRRVYDHTGKHIVSFHRYTDGLNTLTLLASRTHPDLVALGGHPATSGQVGRVKWVLCGDQDREAIQRIRESCR